MTFDTVARANGFESATEMNRLVATAKINTPERLAAFEAWRERDGTKGGLLALGLHETDVGLVHCPFCGREHPDDQVCGCAKEKARVRRLERKLQSGADLDKSEIAFLCAYDNLS